MAHNQSNGGIFTVMRIIVFKVIGLAFGFHLGSGPGAILGLILGHSFDAGLSAKLERKRVERIGKARRQNEANQAFFEGSLAMLAKLVVVDGQESPAERNSIAGILKDGFKLNKKYLKKAWKLYEEFKRDGSSYHDHAVRLYRSFQDQPQTLESVVLFLLVVATCDHKLQKSEDKLIRATADIFQISDERYAELKRNFGIVNPSSNGTKSIPKAEPDGLSLAQDCYTVLGCDRNASWEEIKRSYRSLVADYHPDKIVSKQLPEGFIEFATERFRAINRAYETIKHERGKV